MTRTLTLMATALTLATAPLYASDFTYALGGQTLINADENAIKYMIVGSRGRIVISQEGTITGDGAGVCNYMSPCQWQAPVQGDDYNCVTLSVVVGSFVVSGEGLDWVHRHDDENLLKDAIFAYADANASERPDYAPYRISLTLTPTGQTAENSVYWGLSGGNVEDHATGASALGLFSSGLFDTSFALVALPMEFTFLSQAQPHMHDYSGTYQGGTPVGTRGHVGLTVGVESTLPWQTDPEVYEQHWSLPAGSTEFSPNELEGMEITQEDSRDDAAGEILDTMKEMSETGMIPKDMWLNMGDMFGFTAGNGVDPDTDPMVLEALDLVGNSGDDS